MLEHDGNFTDARRRICFKMSTWPTFFVCFQHTSADRGPTAVFELRLKEFSNPGGLTDIGDCCEGSKISSDRCAGQCSTRFRVCLKHYQTQVHHDECTFGEELTNVLGHNDFHIAEPPIQFDINFKWPVSVSLAKIFPHLFHIITLFFHFSSA